MCWNYIKADRTKCYTTLKGEFYMNIKKMSEEEEEFLYQAADEYQETGIITNVCPYCGGKLTYIGNCSSYRIICENKCGILLSIRGI